MKTRYTVTVEEFDETGVLARRIVESSEKDADDFCDGEKTVGRLLSVVPRWVSAKTGASGLATWANMCRFCDIDGDVGNIFRDIGTAYDRWDAEEDFAKCVEVRTNDWMLNSGDQDQPKYVGYRELWVQKILGSRSVLGVALDVHSTARGSFERGMEAQSEDVRALRRVVETWRNAGACDFDDNVLELVKSALVEAEEYRNKFIERQLGMSKSSMSTSCAVESKSE